LLKFFIVNYKTPFAIFKRKLNELADQTNNFVLSLKMVFNPDGSAS